jgi:hypothetical protein
MGVDQYWQKPAAEAERQHFLDSVEAMLQREEKGGFRGVQSKSLVDLIQLECLSQNSTMLRITNGSRSGRIWIQAGELIDAETEDLKGETAFLKILGWKTGSFEMLPGDDTRERTVFTSYQALLLEIAQAFDESANVPAPTEAVHVNGNVPSPLLALTRFDGVQFILAVGPKPQCETQSWGLEHPEYMSEWTQASLRSFAELGNALHAGPVQQITGISLGSHVALADSSNGELCVGFRSNLRSDEVRETMRNIMAKWAA